MTCESTAQQRLQAMRRIARDLGAWGKADPGPLVESEQADVSWELVLRLADLHTVTPLLFTIYREVGCLGDCPAPVQEHLCQAYDNTCSRAEKMLPEFRSLFQGFYSAGVDFLVLKGLPLIDQLYTDPGARPSYDMDFWLRDRVDGSRAMQVMLDLGYEPLAEEAREHPEGHRHLVPFWKPAPRTASGDYFNPDLPWAVEVHTAFWEQKWWGLTLSNIEGAWERHVFSPVGGTPVPVLSTADNLIYLTMHQMLHIMAGNARLIHLYDLHRLCPRLTAADWEQAWEQARRARLEAYLSAALFLTQDIFATTLPQNVQQAVQRTLVGSAVGRWLRGGAPDEVLLQDWTAKHSSRYRLARLSAAFARHVWEKPCAFGQPLLKTMLPSADFVRQKYGLPAGRNLLPYYLAHIAGGVAGYARQGIVRLVQRK